MNGQPRVQSVIVAHQILEALASAVDGAPLSELARALQMPPPRVLRHLVTLVDLQLVERSGSEPSYRLGSGLIRLAESAAGQHEVTRLALPALKRLNSECGEATYLARERDGEAVVWVSLESREVPHLSMPPGMRSSLTGSACGRVLLAFGEARPTPPLASKADRSYPDPIATAKALEKRLDAIRHDFCDSYGTEEANAVYNLAAPVLDHRGLAVASVGLIGFSILYRNRAEALRHALMDAAAMISRDLGYGGAWPDEAA